MGETNHNLWAPWRMEYIRSLADEAGGRGCFLCTYAGEPDRDAERHVVWRTDHTLTVFNKFPYSNGHLLVAPLAHLADLSDLDDAALTDLFRQVRDAKRLLGETTGAHGFNVGMNFGRCAGAGLPDHLHVHLVPRWNGDTNFMPVLADTKMIPESMDALYARMREAAGALGLPPLCA